MKYELIMVAAAAGVGYLLLLALRPAGGSAPDRASGLVPGRNYRRVAHDAYGSISDVRLNAIDATRFTVTYLGPGWPPGAQSAPISVLNNWTWNPLP